jgi:Cu2+-exporting ATPase
MERSMSCCAPGAELDRIQTGTSDEEVLLASRPISDGLRQTDLSVPDIHCGGCLRTIETALGALDGIVFARANLSARRATIHWRGDTPPPVIKTLHDIGYDAHIHDISATADDPVLSRLLRALAVAGFAASNIMLLSVSIWSGAAAETRDLFHWISALIALPALAYSGQVFFASAWRSLRHGRTNMDVPISIGVLLAFGMSLYETIHHGPHAYFDASVSLLFFLLIGRTLDHMMRARARRAVEGLERLSARGALVLQPDGSRIYLPVNEIEPGMTILLAAGERVPVNAVITKGQSELDRSLVSGESVPQPATIGMQLQAGILNLTGPLTIVATAAAKDSFLADMMRMMEAAEAGRSAYRRIADRASQLYAPVVHTAALLTMIGWVIVTGDWHRAITIAVAVLIVTCPCALGLAVPMVHVVAARRLFENGIMMKDGSALERLATIDAVVFDKTGTLTLGRPRLIDGGTIDPDTLALAGAIAAHSRHPYSMALAETAGNTSAMSFESVSERPGFGLEATSGATIYRLGKAEWTLGGAMPGTSPNNAAVVLSINGIRAADFRFDDRLRTGVRETVATLAADGFSVEILSGDAEQRVYDLAAPLGVVYVAGLQPGDKVRHVMTMKAAGRKVLMVGDGLNDAPVLAAADISMAPGSAADISRNAADLVFLRENLNAIPQAIEISRRAGALVRQNLGLAVIYNLIAVPVAVLGHVTPLVAAIAMSLSSILVVANAMRLGGWRKRDQVIETACHPEARNGSLIAEAAE